MPEETTRRLEAEASGKATIGSAAAHVNEELRNCRCAGAASAAAVSVSPAGENPDAMSDELQAFPVRLVPCDDLRLALEAAVAQTGAEAAFVLSGIGSLRPAVLRWAAADEPATLDEDCELLTLSGTVGAGGSHLHASVSLTDGRVFGGHVALGCRVRTTAEVLLVLLPGFRFDRAFSPATGYAELEIQSRPVHLSR